MRVYISGAISGTNDYMERFQEAEDKLKKQGISVINPAKLNGALPQDITYEEFMALDFALIDMCDCIYMMKGWERSHGAAREINYARAKNLKIWREDIVQPEETA